MFSGPNSRAVDSCVPRQAAPPLTTAPKSATVDDSDSLIRNALCYSEDLLAALHSEISSLEHRLDTGLTPLPPAAGNGAACASESGGRSHVLERVGTYNLALAAAVTRIRDLRLRVEL